MQKLMCVLVLASLAGTAEACATEVITGHARVIDGDTLDIDGRRVRLVGIDAPENGQLCTDAAGQQWDCSGASHQFGVNLTDGHTVTCTSDREDRYGRALGVCQVEGQVVSINEQMVRAGLALAFRKYSTEFVPIEDQARAEHAGMWRGTFETPWDWRKAKREHAGN